MKPRFSQQVRDILATANEVAARCRHDYIGTEHILLALMEAGDGPTDQILMHLGVQPRQLRSLVLKAFRNGRATRDMSTRPYTSRAKKVLEFAMASAIELGGSVVESDQLLLGLSREEKGIAAQALLDVGISTETLLEQVKHERGLASSARSRAAAPKENARGRVEAPVWFLEIDPELAQPIYEQIVAGIEEAVAVGNLSPGERLASVRDLAAELGLAPGTVARAYTHLEQRGIVETAGSRGTIVAKFHRRRSAGDSSRGDTLTELLRPVVVAAFHMGATAADIQSALGKALGVVFPGETTPRAETSSA